jgi:hypothetical protein
LVGAKERSDLRFAVAEGALDASICCSDNVSHCGRLLLIELDEFAQVVDDAFGRGAMAGWSTSFSTGAVGWGPGRSVHERDSDAADDGPAEKDAQQEGAREQGVAIDDHGESSTADDEDIGDDGACSTVASDVDCHDCHVEGSSPSMTSFVVGVAAASARPAAGRRKNAITATTAQAVLPQKNRRAKGTKTKANGGVCLCPKAAARARSVRSAGGSATGAMACTSHWPRRSWS